MSIYGPKTREMESQLKELPTGPIDRQSRAWRVAKLNGNETELEAGEKEEEEVEEEEEEEEEEKKKKDEE